MLGITTDPHAHTQLYFPLIGPLGVSPVQIPLRCSAWPLIHRYSSICSFALICYTRDVVELLRFRPSSLGAPFCAGHAISHNLHRLRWRYRLSNTLSPYYCPFFPALSVLGHRSLRYPAVEGPNLMFTIRTGQPSCSITRESGGLQWTG